MKIANTSSAVNTPQFPPPQTSASGSSGAAFGSAMSDAGRADSHETLNRLLGQIEDVGSAISKRRDLGDVRKYRELVASFLDEALHGAFHTDRDGFFDGRGRMREYALVKRVNTELETLTRNVLDAQKENLDILAQLGTIRGLLVDLMV